MDGEMFPPCSGNLAKAISVASSPLQQRQSISPALFLKWLHLHQSRFPILICNKLAAEAWICLVAFSWIILPHVFFVQAQNEMTENTLPHVFSSE